MKFLKKKLLNRIPGYGKYVNTSTKIKEKIKNERIIHKIKKSKQNLQEKRSLF